MGDFTPHVLSHWLWFYHANVNVLLSKLFTFCSYISCYSTMRNGGRSLVSLKIYYIWCDAAYFTRPTGDFSTTVSSYWSSVNAGRLSLESSTATTMSSVPVREVGVPPSTARSLSRYSAWVSRSTRSFSRSFTSAEPSNFSPTSRENLPADGAGESNSYRCTPTQYTYKHQCVWVRGKIAVATPHNFSFLFARRQHKITENTQRFASACFGCGFDKTHLTQCLIWFPK